MKKNNDRLVYRKTILLILLAAGCVPGLKKSTDCASVVNKVREMGILTKENPVCIILCDLSSSMDSMSLEYTGMQAGMVFNKYYNRADLKFYPIVNASVNPFFSCDMMKVADLSKIEEGLNHNLLGCIESLKDGLADSLEASFNTAKKNRPGNTYILQSVENALKTFRVLDPEDKSKKTLVILSDMLESGISSFGAINLEDQSYQEDLKKISSIPDMPALSQKLEIKVALYTRKVKYMDRHSIFWEAAFYKLGYRGKVLLSNQLSLTE